MVNLLYNIYHVNVCHCGFLGHVYKFWSYSFGHLESVKWTFLYFVMLKWFNRIFNQRKVKTSTLFHSKRKKGPVKTSHFLCNSTSLFNIKYLVQLVQKSCKPTFVWVWASDQTQPIPTHLMFYQSTQAISLLINYVQSILLKCNFRYW